MSTQKNSIGFTLVELLIVISIVGILAAITLAALNPIEQRNRAADGVRLANMEKLIAGIESFNSGEDGYPQDVNNNQNPMDDANGLNVYVSDWPDGKPDGATYLFWSNATSPSNGTVYGLSVDMAHDNTAFKFRSDWGSPEILICTDKSPSTAGCTN